MPYETIINKEKLYMEMKKKKKKVSLFGVLRVIVERLYSWLVDLKFIPSGLPSWKNPFSYLYIYIIFSIIK